MKTLFYFLPNLYLNLILVFFISYFLVELVIKALKIKSPAWQYSFRVLPYLKLIVDPLQYNFNHWTYTQQIPIHSLDSGTRYLNAQTYAGLHGFFYKIKLTLENDIFGFGALDLIFEKWGINIAYIISVSILLFSVFRIIYWAIAFHKESNGSKHNLKQFPIEKLSTSIVVKLKNRNVSVDTSDKENFSPHVQFIGGKKIILPLNIQDILTIKEIEAVILHEIAHLSPFHLAFFIFLNFFQNFFFFIPMKKIHHSLEKLCDALAIKESKHPTYLMSALAKSAHMSIHAKRHLPQFSAFTKLSDRIDTLGNYEVYQNSKLRLVLLTILFIIATSVVLQSQIGHF